MFENAKNFIVKGAKFVISILEFAVKVQSSIVNALNEFVDSVSA